MKQEERKAQVLSHEFCEKFRDDLKKKGLHSVVVELVTSTSDKIPLKKEYIAREYSKKPAFATKIDEALAAVGNNNRSLRPALNLLRKEITGAK